MPRFARLAAGALTLAFTLGSIPLASAQELLESNGRRTAKPETAAAAANARRADAAPAFGTSSTTRVTVGACDATPRNRTHPFENVNCDVLTPPLDSGVGLRRRRLPDPPADGSAHHLGHRELLRQHRCDLSRNRPVRARRDRRADHGRAAADRSLQCRPDLEDGGSRPALSGRRLQTSRAPRHPARGRRDALRGLHHREYRLPAPGQPGAGDRHLPATRRPITSSSNTSRPSRRRALRAAAEAGTTAPTSPSRAVRWRSSLRKPWACTFRTDSTSPSPARPVGYPSDAHPQRRGQMRAPLSSGLVAALSLGLTLPAVADDVGTAGLWPRGTVAPRSSPPSVAVPVPSFGTSSSSRVTLGACDGQIRSNDGLVGVFRVNCERAIAGGRGGCARLRSPSTCRPER